MRQFIKKLIPPIFLEIFRPKPPVLKTKLYSSYEDALKHCQDLDYIKNQNIPQIVLAKTIRKNNEIAVSETLKCDILLSSQLISILLNKKSKINVLDIGGACGAHYFINKKILRSHIEFKWNVVETPLMCQYGSSMANEELHFFSDLKLAGEDLDEIDIVICSGVLQYLDNPRQFLSKIIEFDPHYILIARTSLNAGNQDIFTIQKTTLQDHGDGFIPIDFDVIEGFTPHVNMVEKDFLEIINSKYKTLLKFDDISGIHLVNEENIVGYTVCFEKINRF